MGDPNTSMERCSQEPNRFVLSLCDTNKYRCSKRKHSRFRLLFPPPAFNFAVCCAGYGRFEVYNSTHLFYESLELETRAPMDSFWLIKDRE